MHGPGICAIASSAASPRGLKAQSMASASSRAARCRSAGTQGADGRLRRPKLGLNVAVVLAAAGTLALVLQEAFTAPGASRAATSRPVRARSVAGSARHGPTARRAEASFDPFGWKGALKDTVEGLMDGMQGDDPPSKFEEAMIVEIFQKFDLDKDGVLDLEEFNTLQVTTEGPEAVYDLDQLKQLLEAVDSDHPEPEKGMPFAVYRRLYAEGRLRR
ncbi:unnamed protein product, partial [Polarella glacialis]